MPGAPQSPRRSWRDDVSGGRASNKRDWQKEPGSGAAHGLRFSRRLKIFLAASSLLSVIAGVVILWLLFRHIDPPRLVLIGAGYETNLAVPHNVYGKRGLGDLKQWADEYNKKHGDDHERSMEVRQEELTAEGDPFAKTLNGCTSKSVVVFVAVHGGASPTRGAYLLPNNATPRDGLAAYTLDKAIAALEKLPQETKKLLILDTTQVSADWDLGLLHNDFVRSLKNYPRLKNVPNLVVFCASDENQRSWVSEDYGRTVFAHFVVLGLKGGAQQNSDTNLLTAQSLIEYVQREVESWVRHNRGEQQKPFVLDPNNVAKSLELPPADTSAYQEPDPAKLPAFTAPPELWDAWKQRDALASSFPHPATYTPHLWRQYHESLLRYEQLLRAGDSDNAGTLAQELAKLVARIRQSQRLDYDALAASLATPTALGWSLPDADEQKLRQDFDALWAVPTSKPEDFGRLLKEWQAAAGDASLKQLGRVRIVALLLDRARRSDADFRRVCAILPEVDDKLPPRRPAEAHFALMMQTFVPAEMRDWQRLQTALVTRLHAEQAALGLPRLDDGRTLDKYTAYSEQLLPWLRSDVEYADQARRLREDLLFASPKEAMRPSGNIDADALYATIQERAGAVHAALQMRDHVLADFPYYSRWLAAQPLSALPANEEKRWLETWDDVHELCRLLDAPTADAGAVQAQTKKIHFDDLEKRFADNCDQKSDSVTPKNYRRLQTLLSVPLIPADLRQERFAEAAQISRELNVGTKKADKLTAVDDTPTDRDAQAKAQLQGRFALHLLGTKHPLYEKIEPTVANPGGDWQTALSLAGEQLGDAFTAQNRKLYDDTDAGRKAPLDEAAKKLNAAALHVRLASGAAVAAWSTLDPVGENRSVQMVELMKWQGERTFADYWTSRQEDDQRNPYYRSAGGQYVAAAKALAGNDNPDLSPAQKTARLQGLAKLEADLAADDKLELRWRDGETYAAGPSPLWNITDEERVRRGFCLVCGPTTPEGIPVVWPNIGKGLDPVSEDERDRRALDHIPRKPNEARVEYVLKPERPLTPTFDKGHTRFALEGFYRGRRFEQATEVTLHYLPEIASFAPQMPPAGRLTLLANKEDYDRFAAENNELVIVVDYSGSMGPVEGHPEIPSRISRVLKALKECLRNVPRGVKVTLLTFSFKGSDEQNSGIQVQWPKEPWDPDTLDKKMAVLSKLTPWGYTPLVLATVEGSRQFTEDFDGAKTLLVLTDGGDNLYKSRDAATLKTDPNSMAQCLKKYFVKKDIAVNVVGFELKQLADEGEKEGLKKYKAAIEAIDGTFLEVEKGAELAEQLEQQLLQIRFHLDEKGGKLPAARTKPQNGYPISTTQEKGQQSWVGPLKPGLFNVVIQTNRLKRDARTQLVDVGPGESVVLKLASTPDHKGFQIRRETYADSFTIQNLNRELHRQEVRRRDSADKTWILSVLQNQAIRNNITRDGVRMMVSLEERNEKPQDGEASLGITKPSFVWFRAAAAASPTKNVPGLRFYRLADYSAPCYQLDYLHWTAKEPAQLDIWWNERPLPEGGVVIRPEDKALTQLVEKPVKVPTVSQTPWAPVVVESIAQERRAVVLRPGEPATKEVDCLVVRLRYPADGEPFFVQLPPGKNVGAEHRFYTEAGKYTGIFWNVSAATAEEMKSLTIYSVAGVLQEAQHVGPLPLKVPDNTPPPPKPQDPQD